MSCPASKNPGAEPGVDPSQPDGGLDTVPTLHTACRVTVVDFSQEDLAINKLNNSQLVEFIKKPQPDWVKCRWINVNSLSYANHAFFILTCQKLVRMAQGGNDNEESDHERESITSRIYKEVKSIGNKIKRWFDGKMVEYLATASALETGSRHSSTSASNTLNTNALRTLQRYRAPQNTGRVEYLEKLSPLSGKGIFVTVEQVSIFLTSDNTVVAFFEQSADDVEKPILARLRSPTTMIRQSCDASMVSQALIDGIIDLAIPVTAAYSDAVGDIELDVLLQPQVDHANQLYILGAEVNKLYSLIYPIQALINSLRDHKTKLTQEEATSHSGGVVISPRTCTYLGDVYDHCVIITESLNQIKQSAGQMRELTFNTIAVAQNTSIKSLSMVTILFLPLTFLVGFFGMNFDELKEGGVRSFWVLAPCFVVVTFACIKLEAVLEWQKVRVKRSYILPR
ncbi:hypothetical protein GGR54DRAFT_635661 [Hypoxylon sp. NC1633]|nr:hypothetical protein GGR54DRAFT_635661 [Hypoxylon sp. NC1633]